MSEQDREPMRVRSYRGVLDGVERRIYRVDRWRLPNPGGVSVRAVIYGVACILTSLIAAQLPVAGQLGAVVPDSVRFFALPVVCAWALASWAPDGRPPHSALRSLAGYLIRPRTLSGLRKAPAAGESYAPVAAVQIASTGDGTHYPSGRVRGPAALVLRYPAAISLDGASGESRAEQLATAKRIRVSEPDGGRGRPLPAGRRIEIPETKEVIFQ